MKKNLLLTAITVILLGLTVSAQQSSEIQCKKSMDEILMEQSFGIDDPISEDARYIVEDLINRLNEFYEILSANELDDLEITIEEIDKVLVRAKEINLNLSMFDADLIEVESHK